MSVALDSVMESQAAQLNLLLYQIYRPYFNGKACLARGGRGICHPRPSTRSARAAIFFAVVQTLNRVGGPWVTHSEALKLKSVVTGAYCQMMYAQKSRALDEESRRFSPRRRFVLSFAQALPL